jgi:hypothetical protein
MEKRALGAVRRVWPRETGQSLAPVISPDVWRPSPLAAELTLLRDPDHPVTDELVLNLTAKYFYAFAHPDSCFSPLRLDDLTALFAEFAAHREDGGSGNPGIRRLSFALRMLGDLSKTAHILRAIAGGGPSFQRLEKFTALDLGTGSGILLLAAHALGRRKGFERTECVGVEADREVAARAAELANALGFGEIIVGDARDHGLYSRFRGRPVAFVSNETIPAVHQRMAREHFMAIHRTLFESLGPSLRETLFFPEGLIIADPDRRVSVVLSRNNGFQVPDEYRRMNFYPRAVAVEGRIVSLHRLGEDFEKYLSERSRGLLSKRW